MTAEYFKKTLQKIIKKMKCDIYVIGPDFIIGSNPENSYISEVIGLTNGLENIYEKFPGSIIEITKDGLNETEIMIDILKSLKEKKIDLIILDRMLPSIDGISILSKISKYLISHDKEYEVVYSSDNNYQPSFHIIEEYVNFK